MSLVALLGRFTLAYVFLLCALAIGFHLVGMQSNSAINSSALMGAVIWSCLAFATKNGRYLTRAEQRSILLGMLAVDLLLQSVLLLLVSATSPTPLPLGPVFYALAFVGGLHALAIVCMIGIAGKQYARQAARTPRG